MSISPSDKMIARQDGSIGWIIFNQPERHNAVSLAMWQALEVIVDHYEHNPDIRVVIVRGAGDKAFVSGADISEFDTQRSGRRSVTLDHRSRIGDAVHILGQRLLVLGTMIDVAHVLVPQLHA